MSPEQATETSEVSRIPGIFFEPSKTFRDIAQRPSWFLPMILAILAGIGFGSALSQRVGWERIIHQQLDASSRFQQATADQREQAVALQMRFMPVEFYGGAVLGPPILYVIIAAVLLGMTALMSAGLGFKQVFGVVAWAGLPRVISLILTIVVIFLKNPDEFNIRNPTAFNVGAFLDPSGSKFLYTLATSLDLFTIWTIILLAKGLKAAAGKRLSFPAAFVAVATPWMFTVLCAAAMVSAFM
jgi:hypothetical protein